MSPYRGTHVFSLSIEKKDGNFRWFAGYAQAVTANQKPEHPEDMPNLAAVLGFAFKRGRGKRANAPPTDRD